MKKWMALAILAAREFVRRRDHSIESARHTAQIRCPKASSNF
jgi:hypothetical protein